MWYKHLQAVPSVAHHDLGSLKHALITQLHPLAVNLHLPACRKREEGGEGENCYPDDCVQVFCAWIYSPKVNTNLHLPHLKLKLLLIPLTPHFCFPFLIQQRCSRGLNCSLFPCICVIPDATPHDPPCPASSSLLSSPLLSIVPFPLLSLNQHSHHTLIPSAN